MNYYFAVNFYNNSVNVILTSMVLYNNHYFHALDVLGLVYYIDEHLVAGKAV